MESLSTSQLACQFFARRLRPREYGYRKGAQAQPCSPPESLALLIVSDFVELFCECCVWDWGKSVSSFKTVSICRSLKILKRFSDAFIAVLPRESQAPKRDAKQPPGFVRSCPLVVPAVPTELRELLDALGEVHAPRGKCSSYLVAEGVWSLLLLDSLFAAMLLQIYVVHIIVLNFSEFGDLYTLVHTSCFLMNP